MSKRVKWSVLGGVILVIVAVGGLTAAKRQLRPFHVMTARREFGPNLLAKGRLQRQHAIERERTRRFGCRLNIHAEIEHIGEKISVTGRLVMSAHHAERHQAFFVLHYHARNDGVHGPLIRRQRIGMARLETKTIAAIVQENA